MDEEKKEFVIIEVSPEREKQLNDKINLFIDKVVILDLELARINRELLNYEP